MVPLAICLVLVLPFTVASKQPHILHILVDDFGWADAGWHRPADYKDLQSPNMVALVKEGVELNRHYVFKYCSPTRSAVQSGRNPTHVNVLNADPASYNEKDPVSGYAAIPRNMTGMAEHMVRAGYETHMYGKWDAGMATPQHTPAGRGYQKSLHYFHHANDYWNSRVDKCYTSSGEKVNMVDLWDTNAPALGQNNSEKCSQKKQDGCVYEDELFANAVIKAIEGRTSKPLFIFWAPHAVHTPLQVPQKELDLFSFIKEPRRQLYHAMVYFVDSAIGRVAQRIKDEGMWDNTLIVLSSDNGGPVNRDNGANNYPLRGGKFSNFEGGIRVNAFASGGLLPKHVRGTKQEGVMAGWDWYATFATLAGVDPTDKKAAAAGLPPHDSINMWPLLSGQVTTSPRKELELGSAHMNHHTTVAGLIWGQHKILTGKVTSPFWTGPVYPNTTVTPGGKGTITCGEDVETGCLFDVVKDPTEHVNIAKENADLFKQMLSRVQELRKNVFDPDRGSIDPLACRYGLEKYGGFFGPFIDVEPLEQSFEALV